MIKIFQNQLLESTSNIANIDFFRIPDHVQLSDILGFDFDVVVNCVEIDRHPCIDDSDLREELWNHLKMHDVYAKREAPPDDTISEE